MLFSSPPEPSTNVTVDVVSAFVSALSFLGISMSFFDESLLEQIVMICRLTVGEKKTYKNIGWTCLTISTLSFIDAVTSSSANEPA